MKFFIQDFFQKTKFKNQHLYVHLKSCFVLFHSQLGMGKTPARTVHNSYNIFQRYLWFWTFCLFLFLIKALEMANFLFFVCLGFLFLINALEMACHLSATKHFAVQNFFFGLTSCPNHFFFILPLPLLLYSLYLPHIFSVTFVLNHSLLTLASV